MECSQRRMLLSAQRDQKTVWWNIGLIHYLSYLERKVRLMFLHKITLLHPYSDF